MKFFALVALLPAAVTALVTPVPAIEARQVANTRYNIHPNGDTTKCIGILGGQAVINASVDIYDCNGSATQKWSWDWREGLSVANPTTGADFCFDLVDQNNLNNGNKVVLKTCSVRGSENGIPTQGWGKPGDVPGRWDYKVIQLSPRDQAIGHMCLDLTNGDKTNRNVLQIWQCNPDQFNPWRNQIWTLTQV